MYINTRRENRGGRGEGKERERQSYRVTAAVREERATGSRKRERERETSGRGRALDGRLDRSNRSRPGREPGARAESEKESPRERERKTERTSGESETDDSVRGGGEGDSRSPRRAAFAEQLLRNRCLDDTHPRMRARNARRTRSNAVKSARAPPSPSLVRRDFHHHRYRDHHRHRYPPPPPLPTVTTSTTSVVINITTTGARIPPPSPPRVVLCSRSSSLSLSLPPSLSHHFSLRPRPRGGARRRRRTRAHVNAVNGSARCHRRETSFRDDLVAIGTRVLLFPTSAPGARCVVVVTRVLPCLGCCSCSRVRVFPRIAHG